ncbi:hypothetical protein [Brevibacterium otitidis]|uniref:Uncharacterized protein n=1 Tax=Brevibacterium otitidis TaxID=53364 RepID=A0ABV5X5C4_9MICO|nr:hypothetical protein GCM10023233_03510 [Brevibacterium otitidis]
MKRSVYYIAFAPFAVGGVALALFCLLMMYLFIFGSLLGFNVSSLDADGPQWPMAAAWYLGMITVISIPVGAVWAGITVVLSRPKLAS